MALEELYKEVILDHYKNPRNKRDLPGGELSCALNNPLCGDQITIHARLDDGRMAEVTFAIPIEGCADGSEANVECGMLNVQC